MSVKFLKVFIFPFECSMRKLLIALALSLFGANCIKLLPISFILFS